MGFDALNGNSEIDLGKDLLDFILELPNQSLLDAKMILSEFYEIRTGICNHPKLHKTRPLSTVAFHDAEEITKGSLLEEALQDYLDLEINNFFGLNINEYLSLPSDIVQLLRRLAEKALQSKGRSMADLENQLKGLV